MLYFRQNPAPFTVTFWATADSEEELRTRCRRWGIKRYRRDGQGKLYAVVKRFEMKRLQNERAQNETIDSNSNDSEGH